MSNKLKSVAGMTLIEILSTLVVIGILTSMAAPRFETAFGNIRLRSANKDIVSSLRLARSKALTDKRHYGVLMDAEHNTITVFRDSANLAGYSLDLPDDSVIRVDTLPLELSYIVTDVTNNVITFAPNGTADFEGGSAGGANIGTQGYVGQNGRCYNIEVRRATGRVRWDAVACGDAG
ncbi:MAG: GspH/FimT family pseudopilin [bacterium]